jgi:hypothetical protein
MRDEAARAAFELQVLTAVAANLGVDVAQLQAALEAARPDPAALKAQARTHLEERLAAQVASGKMTQERADEMLARFDAGTFSKFRGAERGDRGEQVRPAGRGGPGQRA